MMVTLLPNQVRTFLFPLVRTNLNRTKIFSVLRFSKYVLFAVINFVENVICASKGQPALTPSSKPETTHGSISEEKSKLDTSTQTDLTTEGVFL